jgi:hypothetical protein
MRNDRPPAAGFALPSGETHTTDNDVLLTVPARAIAALFKVDNPGEP